MSKRSKWQALLKTEMVKRGFNPNDHQESLNSIDPPRFDFTTLKPIYLERLLDDKIESVLKHRKIGT